jgi:hypothetical protein
VGDPLKARVTELNRAEGAARSALRPGGKVKQLAAHIREDQACSACYAGLVFALSRMDRNELARLKEPVAIGQGFRGKKGGVGVGQCCSGCTASCPGCPPSGMAVLEFLQKNVR